VLEINQEYHMGDDFSMKVRSGIKFFTEDLMRLMPEEGGNIGRRILTMKGVDDNNNIS